ncbi:MAG: hypothetical protein HeimC3_55190 [Candidatus Heimdallarchaeota archaeon LC_3]|nr:MAG: hypothetical protein HeimC3_55190 [Candidatus Heimdallarchaeota archaeon LC_3]
MSKSGDLDGQDLIDDVSNELQLNEQSENYEIRQKNKKRKDKGFTKDEARSYIRPQTHPPRTIEKYEKIPKYLKPIESKTFRRIEAKAKGTEVKYLGCLMCGKTSPMTGMTKDKEIIDVNGDMIFVKGRPRGIFGYLGEDKNQKSIFLPFTDRILQTRIGGGRQIGFHSLPDKDIDLEALHVANENLFRNIKSIAQQIVFECERIEKI